MNRRVGIPQSVTRWLFRASIVAVLLLPVSALADELVSPCPPIAASAFPALGAPPVVGVWHEKELRQANWTPPSCTGWAPAARSRLLVTLTGQFKNSGLHLGAAGQGRGGVHAARSLQFRNLTAPPYNSD